MRNWNKWAQAGAIFVVFVLFRALMNRESFPDQTEGLGSFYRQPRVQRQHNPDASLSRPFLDKINSFWLVKGKTQIRNMGTIQLTSRGQPGQYGAVISNGAGDNVLDDFETIVSFKIYNNQGSAMRGKRLMGDGMVVMLTPEKQFVSLDLLSSYARRQYEHNSGGILYNDHELMGLPRNLPGLAVVVDTFRNDQKTKINAPFASVLLIVDPQRHHYDAATDGRESTGFMLAGPLKLKNSLLSGKDAKLRIISLESIGFLKIDIAYSENDEWIELYQKDTNLFLPKNQKTGERYIAIGALTGELSETVEIQNVQTSEFHWDGHDYEQFDFAEEMRFFLAHEYGERIDIKEDDFNDWKIAKAQGKTNLDLHLNKPSSSPSKTHSILKWSLITLLLYGLSMPGRIALKRMRMVHAKKHSRSILG
ncbi:LAME_0G05688g1_1 [Lachancea meyersii CBS 8951]|uniref:LAME_0G05688g1_1 n=1 Tax=Lachancea meyersii CBS 8951 TaxID=1266667 RepID=A0A1G4K7C8_9SACH|nr:LAME_0G05688g1_1 [Lachancea meyersii CBS 8951]